MVKQVFSPLTYVNGHELEQAIVGNEYVRAGRLDLNNLTPNVLYPLSTIVDMPSATNPINSHKFFTGACPIINLVMGFPVPFIAYWTLLIGAVRNNQVLSAHDFEITVRLGVEGPSTRLREGNVNSGRVEIPIGPHKRVIDWSFFPSIEYMTNKQSPIDVFISGPQELDDSIEFFVNVSVGDINEDKEDYVVVNVKGSLLMEECK